MLFFLLVLFILLVQKPGQAQQLQWSNSISSPVSGNIEYLSVATDAAGNVYYVGIFQATLDFDPGTATENLTPGGSKDGFIQKFDSNGNYQFFHFIF